VSHYAVEDVSSFESYNLDADGRSYVRLINHCFMEDTTVNNTFPPGLYISMLGQCGCQKSANEDLNSNSLYDHQYVVAIVDELQSSQINFANKSTWQTFALMLPLDKLQESGFLADLRKQTPMVTPGLRFAELGPIPNDLLRCCEAVWSCDFEGFERELFIKAKAQEVLALFLHKRRQKTPATIKIRLNQLNNVLNYIQKNLEQDWSLSSVAKLANSNQTYVKKDIKALVGNSFREWLKKTRLEAACEQLAGTQPITQIAHNIGFKSQAHFATFFKAELGATPSRYRQSLCIKSSA